MRFHAPCLRTSAERHLFATAASSLYIKRRTTV